MNANTVVVDLDSIDQLESSLLASYRAVSEATHRFLVLLREFDLRQGYKAYGNNDCAEWLNWRCGIQRTTALEKLRVARALRHMPQIEAAFAKGDLSYSKVRALTRLSRKVDEAELLDYALAVSASQLDGYCGRLRNGDPEDAKKIARQAREGRSLTRHYREDGSGVMTVELPRAELELVMAAIERVAGELPEDRSRSLFASAADALVAMARGISTPTSRSGTPGSTAGDAYQVVVHIEAQALEGHGGQSDLPLSTVKRLCCDGGLVPVIEGDSGDILSVGRKQRAVPTAIRRALQTRDRSCRFPGCHHERFLDAHHIRHWADGGETSLENLVLLCTHHHTLMHEEGFRLERRGDGTHYFARPDGRPVETAPAEDEAGSAADRPYAYEIRDAVPLYIVASLRDRSRKQPLVHYSHAQHYDGQHTPHAVDRGQ